MHQSSDHTKILISPLVKLFSGRLSRLKSTTSQTMTSPMRRPPATLLVGGDAGSTAPGGAPGGTPGGVRAAPQAVLGSVGVATGPSAVGPSALRRPSVGQGPSMSTLPELGHARPAPCRLRRAADGACCLGLGVVPGARCCSGGLMLMKMCFS